MSLEDFHNLHKGRRAFVVGNGPSLKKLDMSMLRDEITFGANRVFLGFKDWGFPFAYWSSVDETLIKQSGNEFSEELPNSTFKFIPTALSHYFDVKRMGNCHQMNVIYDPDPFPQLSTQPNEIFDGWCMAYVLLQLALVMGCSPIYLIGVDYNYEIPQKDLVDGGKRWISNNSQNHFTSEYCNGSKGQIWNLPRFDKTDEAFAFAADWSNKNGNFIFNATPGSHLDAFPKVDYNSLFTQV
jgi:hypothetical protein